MNDLQDICKRCGKCCENGGPALHEKDLQDILAGKIPLEKLITIRKGEYVYNPLSESIQPAKTELIKIKGKPREWSCIYYIHGSGACSIYEKRPVACRTLKCWDSSQSLSLIEEKTLSRLDIISQENSLYNAILEYDVKFPCPDFERIVSQITQKNVDEQKVLEILVNDEIAYRTLKVQELNLSLGMELFCFGRPLFQQLQTLGVSVTECGDKLYIKWPK
jgi:Fe-S-cluster containining protein